MKDDQPRTLTALFGAAKDTSELMLDLAYAALLYDDLDLASEVVDLERRLAELVQGMREVCMLAARSVADAVELAAFLRLTDAITTIAEGAVDIAKIVIRRLGLPAAMRADLADAVEVTDRIPIASGSRMDGAVVADAEADVPAARILAVRRQGEWILDPAAHLAVTAGDIVLVRGSIDVLAAVRYAAGQQVRTLRPADGDTQSAGVLDQAIDTLVEMKNVAEVAVALAYATVLAGDPALAGQVTALEDRLDEMREAVETWVLTAAANTDPAQLRGLLHVAVAAEDIGDAAQAMVWPVEQGDTMHPVVADALTSSEDSVTIIEIPPESALEGRSLASLEPRQRGLAFLALARAGRWDYRPAASRVLHEGDRLITSGPTTALEGLHRAAEPADADA